MRIIKGGIDLIGGLAGKQLSRATGLDIEYLGVLQDDLERGPHHVDLEVQRLLRQSYLRKSCADGGVVDAFLDASSSHEVIFWCEWSLRSCLQVLWALDAIATRGGSLENAYLAIAPGRPFPERFDPDAVRRALQERAPIGELSEPLIAMRRYVASDTEEIAVNSTPFPGLLGEWVCLAGLLADFLPDERGIDLADGLLLEGLTDDWAAAIQVIGDCHHRAPPEHSFDERMLWDRLVELSAHGNATRDTGEGWGDPLVDMTFDDQAHYAITRCRITSLGKRVRSGKIDATKRRPFFRWVGGRLLTNDRLLRRSARLSAGGASASGR